MKDLRVYLADLIIKWELERESKALDRQKLFLSQAKTEKEAREINRAFWSHVRFNIDEMRHAYIEEDAMWYANHKSKETGREDLATWYGVKRYYTKVLLEKFLAT